MKRVLIISNTTETGHNFRQMMEVVNLLGGLGLEISTIKDAEKVKESDITRSDKIILVVPEWNGSFPWTFKKMIDSSGYPSSFQEKDVLLIGTSSSTFGNLMGVTQLQFILEFCGAYVYSKKVCVPKIQEKFANDNIIIDERLQLALIDFVNNF